MVAILLVVTQSVPERSLPAATQELRGSFTGVGSIRELSDGRVLVVDREDKVVRLVDLTRGTAAPVGRQGGGPGEYNRPFRLLPLGGDTTLLVDAGLQRSIVIGPDGAAGDVVLSAGAMVSAPRGARTPGAVDSRGRLYFLGSGPAPGSDPAAGPPDSVPLLRFDRRTGRVDTLARVRQAKPNILIAREGTRITSVNIRKVPFTPHDDWAVAPDGRLVIVRTDPYRLDQQVASATGLTRGPRIAYAPVAVVDADRIGVIDPLPKYKPPFEGPSTSMAPDGRVWVRRTTAAADSTARYDVFDASGRMVARVVLPPRTRLAGFGRATIYLVRRDEDDLEYLGRETLPVL
jgi:hypothetical protein